MEDQGIVRQPLLKNGHVGTMDDKGTEGDLTFEDTPAYVALRDVLETRYRVKDISDVIIDGFDLRPNSDAASNACKRATWAITGIGLLFYDCFNHEVFVPAQHLGLFMNSKNEYVFAESGMHNVSGLFWTFNGLAAVNEGNCIRHGNRTVVIVNQGELGYATDRGQPVLLPPGVHSWTSETLKYEVTHNLSNHLIRVGPYTIVTVDEGYVSISQDNGKQRILTGGETHFLNHMNWKHEKYLSLKIQTDDIESIEATTADNVNVLVTSTVNWRIVHPEVTAVMAANTQTLSGTGETSADITKLRRDVLKQALASMATFVGSVNYSGSFHVSAAHNADRAKSTQAKLALAVPAGDESTKGGEASAPVDVSADLYLENPLYNSEKMSAATAHANSITSTYGIEIISINIISAVPCDKKLTSSLASGAVAAAESLVAETAARGQAAAQMIAATADADAMLLRAEGMKAAAIKKAEGEAEGIKKISDALSSETGASAAQQRLAEQYISQYADMSKNANTIIVPDKPNDISGVLATAMAVGKSAVK